MSKSSTLERWLPTGLTVASIGISKSTLHRWKNSGLLVEGTHFRYGLTPNSPNRWNPEAIEQAIQTHRALPNRPGLQG